MSNLISKLNHCFIFLCIFLLSSLAVNAGFWDWTGWVTGGNESNIPVVSFTSSALGTASSSEYSEAGPSGKGGGCSNCFTVSVSSAPQTQLNIPFKCGGTASSNDYSVNGGECQAGYISVPPGATSYSLNLTWKS